MFCEQRGMEEVFTPYLVRAGAFEGVIDTIKASGAKDSWELHTSPEIEMKKLLSERKESFFQIARCFRDDPPTPHHLKEFTMLEYYRVGCSYTNLIDDMKELIRQLSPSTKMAFVSVSEAMKKHGLDLSSTAEDFRGKIHVSENDSWSDLFCKLLVEKIEPSFDPEVVTFLTDYPKEQCALGKLAPDGKTAQRFEIFWKGMEICNGCTELTDPNELLARYEKEVLLRRERGLEPHPFPEVLYASMKSGIPECAGIAIGLDRLYRARLGIGGG